MIAVTSEKRGNHLLLHSVHHKVSSVCAVVTCAVVRACGAVGRKKEESEPFALLAADVDDVEVDPGVLERSLGNGGRAEARQKDVHVVGLIPARHDLVQLLQIAV